MEQSTIVSIAAGAVSLLASTVLFLIRFALMEARLKDLKDDVQKIKNETPSILVLQAELKAVQAFHQTLMSKMADLILSQHTPEMDKLLLRLKRGEALDLKDLQFIRNEIEHETEELLRVKSGVDVTARQVVLSIFLAMINQQIEAHYNRQDIARMLK